MKNFIMPFERVLNKALLVNTPTITKAGSNFYANLYGA